MFVCVLLCWLHRCAYMLTASLHVCYRHLVSVWPDYILSVLLCTLPMPMPCLLPRAAHPARCTPSRYVCFPVLWFLFPVSCAMYILRARLFCPLYLPLYALYFDMLRASVCSYASCTPVFLYTSCALVPAICLRSVSCGVHRACRPFLPVVHTLRSIVLMCCAPLCITVSCLFLCYMCVLCFDPCALSVPSFTHGIHLYAMCCVLFIWCNVYVLCLFSYAVQFCVLCWAYSRVFLCSAFSVFLIIHSEMFPVYCLFPFAILSRVTRYVMFG